MKLLNYLMLAMFLFSVIVQYNDPDPLVWVTLYGLAAAACVVAIKRPAHWLLPGGVGAVSLLWALSLVPRVWGKVAFGELFEAWEMKDMRVEEARELGGVLIVTGWMLVLFYRACRIRLTGRRPAAQD